MDTLFLFLFGPSFSTFFLLKTHRRKHLQERRNRKEEVRRVVPTISVQQHMMVHQQCVCFEHLVCPLEVMR